MTITCSKHEHVSQTTNISFERLERQLVLRTRKFPGTFVPSSGWVVSRVQSRLPNYATQVYYPPYSPKGLARVYQKNVKCLFTSRVTFHSGLVQSNDGESEYDLLTSQIESHNPVPLESTLHHTVCTNSRGTLQVVLTAVTVRPTSNLLYTLYYNKPLTWGRVG